MISRLLAPAALVLAALASGCGNEPQPSGKAVAAEREWKRLVVLVDGKRSTWTVDVPVAAGWTAMTAKGYPGVATITRPFAKGCELFLQVMVVGSSDGAPEVGPPRSRSGVERGDRTVVVETPSGKQHFDVDTHLAQTKGLVFGGGATGPGGFAMVEFVPRAQLRDVPAVTVLAQGGTDGAGCFSVSLKSAPGLAHRALDPIARATRLEFDG